VKQRVSWTQAKAQIGALAPKEKKKLEKKILKIATACFKEFPSKDFVKPRNYRNNRYLSEIQTRCFPNTGHTHERRVIKIIKCVCCVFSDWFLLPLAGSKPHDAVKVSAEKTPKFNLLGEFNFLSHTKATLSRRCSLDNIGCVITLWDSTVIMSRVSRSWKEGETLTKIREVRKKGEQKGRKKKSKKRMSNKIKTEKNE
jgi:hypothetical protein